MHFSKATGGFYTKAVHGNNIPDDSVKITTDQYTKLLADQSAGATISADASGNPLAVFPASKSVEEIRITAIKEELAAIDIKRIRPLAEGDAVWLKTYNDQAAALRDELNTLAG